MGHPLRLRSLGVLVKLKAGPGEARPPKVLFIVVYFEVKMKSLSMMDFSKCPCSLLMLLYLISLTIIGVWGEAPADNGNYFAFYINI